MYAPLIQYLKGVRPDGLQSIDLEEIALIQALYVSYPPKSDFRKKIAFVPELVEGWFAHDFEALTPAFNMRMQPLLRKIIDKLIEHGVTGLNPGELAYLRSLLHTVDHIKGKDESSRLVTILKREEHNILAALESTFPTAGVPELFEQIAFATEKTIKASPRSNVTTFGGIELALNGPTFKHTGDLKILDNVPEDTMVVVDGGSCYVNGYVMGHIAVEHACEVRENIAGTVIAGRGAIHARTIVTRAYVVSKWSDIVVESCLDPELVFAGDTLHVHKDARLGVYAAPTILIGGAAQAGEFTFSESCRADVFAPLDTRNLVLEMQDRISCDVYGGLVDPDAGRTIARINRARSRHEHLTRSIKVLHTEIEHFAGNAIMYLLGGELIQKHIEEISRKQRRIAFLDRIINGIEAVAKNTRLQLIQQQRMRAQRRAAAYEAGMDELHEELAGMRHEEDLDSDLASEGRELHSMTAALTRREPVEISALRNLAAKRVAWMTERDKAVRELEKLDEIVQKSMAPQTQSADVGQQVAGKMHLLNQMMESVKSKSNQDPMLQRSRSNFIQFILRSIDQRKHRMLHCKTTMDAIAAEHEKLCERLRKKHNMEPPSDDDEHPVPTVTGRFEEHVALCTDKFLIDDPNPDHQGILFTSKSDNVRTFSLEDGNIVEKPTAS